MMTTPRNLYGNRIYPDNPINYQLPVTTRTSVPAWRPPDSQDNYFRVRSRTLGSATSNQLSLTLLVATLLVASSRSRNILST